MKYSGGNGFSLVGLRIASDMILIVIFLFLDFLLDSFTKLSL